MNRTAELLSLLAIAALAGGCGGGEGPEAANETQQAQEARKSQQAQRTRQALRAREAREAACRQGQTPTAGPVRITLNEGGQVQVRPRHVKLARGTGSVAFDSELPFAVIFQRRAGTLPTAAATAANGARGAAPVKVNPSAGCGRYEYSVAVWDSANRRVAALDPPIDIVPTGPGTGGTDSTGTR